MDFGPEWLTGNYKNVRYTITVLESLLETEHNQHKCLENMLAIFITLYSVL